MTEVGEQTVQYFSTRSSERRRESTSKDLWNIITELGRGGFGVAYHTRNRRTEEDAVVKLSLKPEYNQRLAEEIRIHRSLRHRNILRFLAKVKVGPNHGLLIEYANGGDLYDRIIRTPSLTTSQARKFFEDMMRGIEYMHIRGIAHLDLKPENLLIKIRGTSERLLIADFGLSATFRVCGELIRFHTAPGSPNYQAPEVIQRYYFPQPADVWSAGVVLFAMLTGSFPWNRAIIADIDYYLWQRRRRRSQLWDDLSKEADAILTGMFETEPEKRLTVGGILGHPWINNRHTCDL